MKITHIHIENLIGVRNFDVPVTHPVLLVAGPNGAGKTSIADAIHMALTGESRRVAHQKDYGKLVHQGADAGMVEIQFDEDVSCAVQISAKKGRVSDHSGKLRGIALETLRCELDIHRFATWTQSERRAFLFGLLQLDLTPEAIKARLIERECDTAKIEAIAPLLHVSGTGAGFEAAAKHAASKATEAKGAFRAHTNEAWGSAKGATWRAQSPKFTGADAAELAGLDKEIAKLEADLAETQTRLGVAQHAASIAKQRAETIEHLRSKAKTYAEHATLVAKAEKELERLKEALHHAQQKAGQTPVEWHSKLTCPLCEGALMDSDDGSALVPWQDPPQVIYDPEEAARIPDLQKAIQHQQRVHERHQNNMREADEAAIALKELDPETKPATEETKAADPETIQQTADTLRQQVGAKRARQRELQAAQRAIDEADEKTKRARAAHADILAWDSIAKALGPDGIPADLIDEAMSPINDRLRLTSEEAQWPIVWLDKDMEIYAGERPYGLLSESERYRCDLLIAEAISDASGHRFLLIDRADVLDQRGWEDLLYLADMLAYDGAVDTMIILATKTREQAHTDREAIQCVYLAQGEIAQTEQLEAA